MFDNGIAVATTIAATAIIFLYFWKKRSGTKNTSVRYPPVSSALSLLGAILRGGVGVVPDHFMRAAEKLGPVICYNFWGRQVIILNGMQAISEAFLRQSETFADRWPLWTETNILNKELRGIGFARYDDTFKKYHKLCLAILKEFGFGVKTVSEIRILRQVQLLKQKFQNFNGHPIDPNSLALESTFSVVSRILFGETFAASDTCHRIFEAVGQFARNIGVAVDCVPLLRFLPYFRNRISIMVQCQKDMFVVIEKGIEYSKSVECESTFVRRFIEIQGPDYDRQDLLYIIRDLCLASSDSVSSTLMWAMVELVNHPEIQDNFQREIDDVVPKDRLPSLDDKPNLPYTEAVILEVMRRHTHAPLYIPHATTKDTEVLGCYIPRECLVMANGFSVHMDPKYWKDPENFRPERFLDGKRTLIGSEYVITFGLGKRSCLGEILARQMVFLFLTSLIQCFNIRPPEDQDSIKLKEVIGVGVYPSEFKARLIRRIDSQGFKN